jgi:hypothetical protein
VKAAVRALVALALAASLTGCDPLTGKQNSGPAPAEAIELVFHAETHPTGLLLNIHIDAVDSRGGSGVNAETGLPYPWDGSRTTPYKHTIYYQPGLVIHATGTVIVGSEEPGDLLTCWWTDKGIEVPGSRRVEQTTPGKLAAHAMVSCPVDSGSN